MLGKFDISDSIHCINFPIEVLHCFDCSLLWNLTSSMNPKTSFEIQIEASEKLSIPTHNSANYTHNDNKNTTNNYYIKYEPTWNRKRKVLMTLVYSIIKIQFLQGQGKIKMPLSTHFWLTIERVDQSFILKPFNLKLTDYVILVQFPSSSTTVLTIPKLEISLSNFQA